MSFSDELKNAGSAPIAVLHEFLIQHKPDEERVHAFVEGPEDPLFYAQVIREFAATRPIRFYSCHGKRGVYDVFQAVTSRIGNYRHTLYFVDKDLSDVLHEIYPSDARIYVTEYYSIENYLCSVTVMQRALSEFVRIQKCTLSTDLIVTRFEEELGHFHKLMSGVMAWIICMKRLGYRPNLNNVNLSEIFEFDHNQKIHRSRAIIAYLCKSTGVQQKGITWKTLRSIVRQNRMREPKTFIRGKYESWFFVQFLKKALEHLRIAVEGLGGSMRILVATEISNVVPLLAPRTPMPSTLFNFVKGHLSK